MLCFSILTVCFNEFMKTSYSGFNWRTLKKSFISYFSLTMSNHDGIW